MQIALDTSLVIGLLVPNDLWHRQAIDLWEAIKEARHISLIALSCRERDISAIASFDGDFDDVNWLKRFSSAEQIRMI